MTRPSQPYQGGYDAGGSKAKSLFSKVISRNDTRGAFPLDNIDEGRHTEAPSRDSYESRSRILRKGVMVTRECSFIAPEEKTPSYIKSSRGSW
jgi:hypothetical protein